MHILIEDKDGRHFARKRSDVRAVEVGPDSITTVYFNGSKNFPIRVKGTVKSFFEHQLTKK